MKFLKRKTLVILLLLFVSAAGIYLIAADHIDAPAVSGTGSDITDFYAFQSPVNDNNMVFVVNVQGLLAPSATAGASFDEDVMIEINIDNSATKDNVEDLVIQATFSGGKVMVYGPAAPSITGKTSRLVSNEVVSANISAYGSAPVIGEKSGYKVFAGPRDDPFFFDLTAYEAIIDGTATAFESPGTDTFAGTNVMSVVIEVPKSSLGSGTINTWVTSNRKM